MIAKIHKLWRSRLSADDFSLAADRRRLEIAPHEGALDALNAHSRQSFAHSFESSMGDRPYRLVLSIVGEPKNDGIQGLSTTSRTLPASECPS